MKIQMKTMMRKKWWKKKYNNYWNIFNNNGYSYIVSEVISYDNLKKKYFNSYSIATNNKKRKLNDKIREELEILFNELIKNDPLFNRVVIEKIKNHKWKDEEGKEYIGEVEIIGFYDLKDEPLKERMNIISQKEVVKEVHYPSPEHHYTVYNADYSSSGHLQYQSTSYKEKPNKIVRTGGGGILGGLLGAGGVTGHALITTAIAGSLAGPQAVPVLIGGAIGLGIGALFGLFSS